MHVSFVDKAHSAGAKKQPLRNMATDNGDEGKRSADGGSSDWMIVDEKTGLQMDKGIELAIIDTDKSQV